jgi:hypothetical protein
MLLLAATDQMSAVIGAVGTHGGAHFLDQAAAAAGASSVVDGSPFFAVVIGVCAVMAALTLALELLVREAAVYVVVLMLPLAFAAMVWPARRIWAVRLTELLVSLILSKFVIVAVLTLAAAAFTNGPPGVSQLLVAMALVLLSVFAPWTLLRILPFTELAASAAGSMRREVPTSADPGQRLMGAALGFGDAAATLPGRLRQQAAGGDSDGFSGFAPRAAASAPAEDSGSEPPISEPPAHDPAASSGSGGAPSAGQSSAEPPDPAGSPTSAATFAAGPGTPAPSPDQHPALHRPWAEGDVETPLSLGPDFVKHGFGGAPSEEAFPGSGSESAPGPPGALDVGDQPDSHSDQEGSR